MIILGGRKENLEPDAWSTCNTRYLTFPNLKPPNLYLPPPRSITPVPKSNWQTMTISAISIMNNRGDVIVNRVYRDDITAETTQDFRMEVIARKETGKAPVVLIGKHSYLYIRHNNLFFVCVTRSNINPALGFSFLYAMLDVFKTYFRGEVNEQTIRNNFTVIYELLDETMDFGYPQNSSVDVLQLYIKTAGERALQGEQKQDNSQITSQITGAVDWRLPDLKYKKNEVFIDILEQVNLLMSADGEILRNDVSGKVAMKTYLTGMPECKFGINDKILVDAKNRGGQKNGAGGGSAVAAASSKKKGGSRKSVEIEDITFHRCVKLTKFDADRTITFVPPDGEFDLMKYRITDNVKLPFKIVPIVEERGDTRCIFNIKAISNFSSNMHAQNVVIKIPCPKNTARCKCRAKEGRARYEPEHHAIVWRIKRFPGGKELGLFAEAELAASTSGKAWSRPPITMEFSCPRFAASGMIVRFLKVFEKTAYQTTKWVRYITRNGQYEIRI